jgi:hypothetical protein
MKPPFRLRRAIVGYVVALAFAFNGFLTSVIGAAAASNAEAFVLITCLGGPVDQQAPGQQSPAQSDHASKCNCSLSCCCAGGLLARQGSVEMRYPAISIAVVQPPETPITRNAGRPLHLRSPPSLHAS